MGCWFGFSCTFSDLLATVTETLFGGWVVACSCTESINSSLNRPWRAGRVCSGNGLRWRDFPPWGCLVSCGQASKGSCENNLSMSGVRPVRTSWSNGCFYSSKTCSSDYMAASPFEGKEKGRVGGFWSGGVSRSLRDGGGGFPARRPPGRGSVLGFRAAPGLLEGRMLITIINKCQG